MTNLKNGEQDPESEVIEYTEEEKKEYERETGKYAVWRGVTTEGFKKWKKGEKIYDRDKMRISFYISEEMKKNWKEFMKIHHYSMFSKLLRESVNTFIENKSDSTGNSLLKMHPQTVSNISHALKEPLTSIKGYSQLLIENYKDELPDEVVSTIKNIFDQSIKLENEIVKSLDNIKVEASEYDVLLIDDHLPTIRLLRSYFESREPPLICRDAISGTKGFDELESSNPKVIFLDIRLPDVNGFELCKKIKQNEVYKNIPLYFLTAIPKSEIEKKLEETGADGYILKPFDFSDFDFLFDILKKRN